MITKPALTEEQKKSFEEQFNTIANNPDAKIAVVEWDGTFRWIDGADTLPFMPGFKREKLHGKLAHDYVTLLNKLTHRTI